MITHSRNSITLLYCYYPKTQDPMLTENLDYHVLQVWHLTRLAFMIPTDKTIFSPLIYIYMFYVILAYVTWFINGNVTQCWPYSRNVSIYHTRDGCLTIGKSGQKPDQTSRLDVICRQTLDMNLLICETTRHHTSLALAPGPDTAPWWRPVHQNWFSTLSYGGRSKSLCSATVGSENKIQSYFALEQAIPHESIMNVIVYIISEKHKNNNWGPVYIR